MEVGMLGNEGVTGEWGSRQLGNGMLETGRRTE